MSTEDVPVEDHFDWNDERRKKLEQRQEKHAQYFSPLSVISELIAGSNEDKRIKSRCNAQKDWDTYVKKEKKKISEKIEKERQEVNQIEDIKAYYRTSKVVDTRKERLRNQELVESFQEDIIEREEYVPAYTNMPKENYLKPEKTRRIQKEPSAGQTTVHCPFCNNKRRTINDLIKHMHQIHSREIREKAEEQTQTEKEEKKEVKVDIQTELEEDGDFHKYLKFSDVQEDTTVHNKTTTSGLKDEKIICKKGKEDDVNKINDLASNLKREIFEKIDESSYEQMGVLQQEEPLPQPATISTASMEKLEKIPQACNNEVDGNLVAQEAENIAPELANSHQQEGQINVQTETVTQKANIAPEVVYSLQQEENENYIRKNTGRRGWLHSMASKVNLFVLFKQLPSNHILIFFQISQRLRRIKGGVTKKNIRRRTAESVSVTSLSSSNMSLLRLRNNGNFCYSNAAVSCILGNPLIKQFILDESGTPGGPLSQLKSLLRTPSNEVNISFFGGYECHL